MAGLDWDKFTQLSGSSERNFELLCRAAIRRNYGAKGDFRSRAQQPGVEFHLRLNEHCDELGDPPRWWGWQCRWYDLPGGRAIGTTRQRKIKKAIRKTEQELPDLTDWVLWTRRPLTANDQRWFYGIQSKMKLHLRTGDDLPDLLTGDATGLREAYFDELILTPTRLAQIRDEGIAAVKRRYHPELHIKMEAEKILEQVLGTPASWSSLSLQATKLRRRATELRADQSKLDAQDLSRVKVGELLDMASAVESRLRDVIHILTDHGAPDAVTRSREPLRETVATRELRDLERNLRKGNEPAALGVHMLNAEVQRARRLLAGFAERASLSMCAVIGGAGRGKSHLAIDLTVASDGTPGGIYFQGRNLDRRGTLNDLLKPLLSCPRPSFNDLLEGLDAAGARAGRRLPLVIDGLNEAEDPARFKVLLSSLQVTTARYPNVLVVLTLRESAFEYAMPDETLPSLNLRGFQQELDEAIDRYFDRYKIRRGEGRLPRGLLRQPLMLWMFCEVANPGPPEQRKPVDLSSLPATPVRIYERFRDESVRRIATEQLSCAEFDVAGGLDRVALALWEQGVRELKFSEVRTMVDRNSDWNKSIARALEDEGVLMREAAPTWGEQPSGVLFDAFAGFLIADAIVREVGTGGIDAWLKDPDNLRKLDPTPGGVGHPLASDILTAFAGVLPTHAHRQLWPYLVGPLREQALADAADLDGRHVDSKTADAIAEALRQGKRATFRRIMHRLQEVRADPRHPLNARFVNGVLRGLPVAERDLRWSEWLRETNDPEWPGQKGPVLEDVREVARAWRKSNSRTETDELRALWFSWVLTSTDRALRDHVTEALYRFGRASPERLFSMTLSTLDLDDVYVPERMLAASYGVAMANQRPVDPGFEDALRDYLSGLAPAMRGTRATNPTSHWLMRTYAAGAWSLAKARYGDVAAALASSWGDPFAGTKPPRGYSDTSQRGKEVDHTFRMDFENYTVGRLYRDRSNYDRTHTQYVAGLAQIRGRIWHLGWREDRFAELDRRIADGQWNGKRMDRPDRVDRYGKKYGWIAYYELAGRLHDDGVLQADVSDPMVDIDPSFPDAPSSLPVKVPTWVRQTPRRLADWVRKGIVEVPDDLLINDTLGKDGDRWVAVSLVLNDHDPVTGRRAWGSVDAVLVTPRVAAGIDAALARLPSWSQIGWHNHYADYYTMAGEMPWSAAFAASVLFYDPKPYRLDLELPGIGRFDAEVVTHDYAWESYHSTTNQQGGTMVPSRLISEALGLTKAPDNFDHVDPDGHLAARAFGGPRNFGSGVALYIRQDVLEEYARRRRREVVLLARGERQPDYELVSHRPQWYLNAVRSGDAEWRFAKRLADL